MIFPPLTLPALPRRAIDQTSTSSSTLAATLCAHVGKCKQPECVASRPLPGQCMLPALTADSAFRYATPAPTATLDSNYDSYSRVRQRLSVVCPMWFIGICSSLSASLQVTLLLSLSLFSASSSVIVHAVSFTGAVLLFKLPLYILVRLLKGRRVASFTLPSRSVCACVRACVCRILSLSPFACSLALGAFTFWVIVALFIVLCQLLLLLLFRPSNLIAVNIFSIFEKRLFRQSNGELQQEERERELEPERVGVKLSLQ